MMSRRSSARFVSLLAAIVLALGAWHELRAQTAPNAGTVAEAERFVADAEQRLNALSIKANRTQWIEATFITEDTETVAAEANEQLIGATTELAKASRRFDGLELPPDVARKLKLLKLSLPMPAPGDTAELSELTRIAASLEADYGKGKYCRGHAQDGGSAARTGARPSQSQEMAAVAGDCLDITQIEKTLATSRNPAELLDLWTGWRTIAPPMRDRYTRFVELSNKGAREMGFDDVGAIWRSNYDVPPDKFAAEVERLWQQVRPLYESLHAYVRRRLVEKYGSAAERADGMIPAHLLGNLWAQQWGNVFDLVAPRNLPEGYDLTSLLRAKQPDALGMVKFGENFFSSLGFAPLPPTFWQRSLFTKPRDREVVCHASAWTIDNKDDIRLKMCIDITADDFVTIHHELGHNYYQRAYNSQPYLFQGSANDGFHEALGDAIALSVTPAYLQRIGLLGEGPPAQADIPLLLRNALDKVAFLPFGLLIDQWRWGVFSGRIAPAQYNSAWWALVQKYQGIAPPVERSERDFDPGAKYHVPANTPYTRYFLAHILEFQFHRAMCRQAGYNGPLNRCSIYGNKEVGARLEKMLAIGLSRPWPDALETLTGQREMDASALLEYFAPLKQWLDEQNKGHEVGWRTPTTSASRMD
jgi:peptidyl-dipeptidase A